MKIIDLLKRKNAAFTLMEILIVMVILLILIAFLAPMVFNQMREARVSQARLQLKAFDQALMAFNAERGNYPEGRPDVPRSGLAVLIGEQNPLSAQPGGMDSGMGMGGPNGSGMGMGDNMGMSGLDGGMGMTGNPPMGGPNGGMGMTGNTGGMSGGPDSGGMAMPDPTRGVGSDLGTSGPSGGMSGDLSMGGPSGGMGGDMGMGTPDGGMGGGMGMSGPGSTPGLDMRQGAGSTKNYLGGNTIPKDPWGQEYFYEYPTNRRVDNSMPAIWSAGPDKISGNDDDVINWKSEIDELKNDERAYQAYLQKQQSLQSGAGGMGGPNVPGVPDMRMGMGMTGQDGMGGMGMGMTQPPGGMGLPQQDLGGPARASDPRAGAPLDSGMMGQPPAGGGMQEMQPQQPLQPQPQPQVPPPAP